MALSGYYLEKAAEKEKPGSKADPDSWAVGYINIGRAQNILEAFDDDNSGFITVNEVNRFTRSRPPGWTCVLSLQVYKAYPLIHIIAFPTGWRTGLLVIGSQARSKSEY